MNNNLYKLDLAKKAWQLKLQGKSLKEIENNTGIKKAYLSFLFTHTTQQNFLNKEELVLYDKKLQKLKECGNFAKFVSDNIYNITGLQSRGYETLYKNTEQFLEKYELLKKHNKELGIKLEKSHNNTKLLYLITILLFINIILELLWHLT